MAVVRHVRVRHEQIAIADRRHAAAARRAAMNRDELAEHVVSADDELGRLALELQILRRQADRRERIDLRVVADRRPPVDDAGRPDRAVAARS
jgi:hypothetical protein